MRKQRIFTSVGVAFALLIVFGGWFLTSELLNQKEDALLSETGSVKIPTPIEKPKEPSEETKYPTLTESEIFTILNLWEFGSEEIPHEPKEGQLTMQQAIDSGKNGLALFSEKGIISKEFLTYEKINAYLCENKPNQAQLLPTDQDVQNDDIRKPEELEPFYSYWTVIFTSQKANISLIINAATGQIWKAKLNYPIANFDLAEIKEENISNIFMDYLNLKGNALFKATVQKSSTEIDAATSQLTLDIYLSNQY